jgi:hypothetical protein
MSIAKTPPSNRCLARPGRADECKSHTASPLKALHLGGEPQGRRDETHETRPKKHVVFRPTKPTSARKQKTLKAANEERSQERS